MKQLYLIGGTMGVGKTVVSQCLKARLARSVFLDGDWCWDMHPFQVTEQTRQMVMENIAFLLNNFLHCAAFDHVIFCWVLHEQAIWDDLLARLDTCGCQVHRIALVCRADVLRPRLARDVAAGRRSADVIARSLPRLPLYDRLDAVRLDVSDRSPEQAAEQIARLARLDQI